MSFGLYFHIPYCVQRCSYCDFTTFEQSSIEPMETYVAKVRNEVSHVAFLSPIKEVDTIYFGGGTPSLLPTNLIVSLLDSIANAGNLDIKTDCEITLEINPATLDEKKLDLYLEAGFNRFSVGAQTFNDPLLKAAGRIHSAEDTRQTLKLLESKKVEYTFDLLFALPNQTIEMVKEDLEEALTFQINHLSAYCLTVPKNHKMNQNRASDEKQVQMLSLVSETLAKNGLAKYEISNFARPGFESKHNSLYWADQPYIGFGLSAHSYLPNTPSAPWGVRFWNPTSFSEYDHYLNQLKTLTLESVESRFHEPFNNFEILSKNEALTDFCHTSFRTTKGLQKKDLFDKFSYKIAPILTHRLNQLIRTNLIYETDESWALTPQGTGLSNQVFSTLTFLKSDL